MAGCQRHAATCAKIEFRGATQFAEHREQRARAQRLLHRLAHFLAVHRQHKNDARGIETESGQARSIGSAVLEGREFMAHPEDGFSFFHRQRTGENACAKSGGRRRVAFGNRRYFMERAAHQTAAENPVGLAGSQRKRRKIDARASEPLQHGAQLGYRQGSPFRGDGGLRSALIPHGGRTLFRGRNILLFMPKLMFLFCSIDSISR